MVFGMPFLAGFFLGCYVNNQNILKILRNQQYIGNLVWGKSTKKLHSRDIRLPREQWTIRENAIEPIIDRAVFDKAQNRLLEKYLKNVSDTRLISKLRILLKRKGRLSARIINECRSTPSSGAYEKHFGSLQRVFDLVGYRDVESRASLTRKTRREVTDLHSRVVQRIRKVGCRFKVIRRNDKIRARVLRFANGQRLSIAICRFGRTPTGSPRWCFHSSAARKRGYVTLLCLCNGANTDIREFWLMPSVADLKICSLLKENDPRLERGVRLRGLRQLKKALLKAGFF
jgi:hypothetical protein